MLRLRYLSSARFIPALFTGLGIWLTGCASYPPPSCEQFEANRKSTDYTTQYQLSEPDTAMSVQNFKELPRGKSVAVRLYKMRVDPSTIMPCHHLTIHKEMFLQRKLRANQALEEVREFYTNGGTLIATKTEAVGAQLRASGYYTGATPLPIPENAPAGKYRIVSKLVIKTKNKSGSTVLAKTSASFQVIPRQ